MLLNNLEVLRSIFNAYAAASITGDADSMDLEELHDFVIECNLEIPSYGWQTMAKQFKEANEGSNDDVLVLHEFLVCLALCGLLKYSDVESMGLAQKIEGIAHEFLGSKSDAQIVADGGPTLERFSPPAGARACSCPCSSSDAVNTPGGSAVSSELPLEERCSVTT